VDAQSVRQLAEELQQDGHAFSYQTVAELLSPKSFRLAFVGAQRGLRLLSLLQDND
jgi:hypothetical protein